MPATHHKSFLKQYLTCFLLAMSISFCGFGQEISPWSSRIIDWSTAGRIDFNNPQDTIYFSDYENDTNNNTTSDLILQSILDELNGDPVVIYFPPGQYRFVKTIKLPDNVIIAGSGATETIFTFDLGGEGHLFSISGETAAATSISISAKTGDDKITIDDPSKFNSGDHIWIKQNDEALVYSDWARSSTGQLNRITAIEGNVITLASPLRLDYELLNDPEVQKFIPNSNTGICCLKIEREDQTDQQYANIHYQWAFNSWVKGVESENCNFAHIEINQSHHIEIEGNYFHHAFDYGGGGKAYGIATQMASSDNLIHNNIFETLRHAMLVQAGANGNVFTYNYSVDPFWTNGLLPSNAAGDLVLHGNYPYNNLFEGNIIQNAIVDDSHDINGHDNTIFRNRIEGYGLIMLDNPSTDQQNIMGNEITNTEDWKGLFVISGENHLILNNILSEDQVNEEINLPFSFYYQEKPAYFGNLPWPPIGETDQFDRWSIPAKIRYDTGVKLTDCDFDKKIITGLLPSSNPNELMIYPNPSLDLIRISSGKLQSQSVEYTIIDQQGKIVLNGKTFFSDRMMIRHALSPGVYFISVNQLNATTTFQKFIVK